jgi:DNA-binding MarR family transcriptional regulator
MQAQKETIGFLINDTARLMKRDFERRARSLGLTRAQWQTLFHLSRHEGCNQAELAELLEIEPITLARIIDRLEESQRVVRRVDAADRRCWRLYLGPEAQPLLERMRELGAQTRALALSGLSEERQALFAELISKIRQNLARPEPAIDPVAGETGNGARKRRHV